ncbi:hypothetical protein HY483_02865 [Candidatus Woesearchaeota archaeon]|nr:hypothetical protein [Candidatus Woesearchaeota archaeon]
MYYAFDVIPYNESFKIIDVAGTAGSGIGKLRDAYGRSGAKIRAKKLVSKFGDLSRGKTVIFAHEHPRVYLPHGRAVEAEDLFRQNSGWKPVLHWRMDAADFLRRKKKSRSDGYNQNREEGRLVESAAKDLGVDVVFGSGGNFYKGALSINYQRKNFDNISESRKPIRISKVGLYVHLGNPRGTIPQIIVNNFSDIRVVNTPNIDRSMECKWYFRSFVESQGIADAFPRYIPVGMGFANYDVARDFLSSLQESDGWPLVVLKPVITWGGWGIRMFSRDDMDRSLRKFCVKSLDPNLEDLVENCVVNTGWSENVVAEGITDCFNEMSPEGIYFSPGWDVWKHLEEENDEVRRMLSARKKQIPKSKIRDMTPRVFPFFEYASAFLEEFIPPQIVKSRKTGKEHAGYIRVCVFDREVILAMWRFQINHFSGEYQSFVGKNCRTFFEGCDEETERKLQEFLNPVIDAFEKGFFERVNSINDLFHYRNQHIRKLLSLAK